MTARRRRRVTVLVTLMVWTARVAVAWLSRYEQASARWAARRRRRDI